MIRVRIVDDSAVARKVLSSALSRAGDIEVVATAMDPYVARSKILKLRPDVVTLDLEMPRMDGLTFLAKLMKCHPLPVVVVSAMTPTGSEAAVRAMELGAVEIIAKTSFGRSEDAASRALADRVRAAAVSRVDRRPSRRARPTPIRKETRALERSTRKILAIGASTGGVSAIEEILANLPPNIPGTVIAEHMPGQFSATFAKRLNEMCPMTVREARNNDAVVPGVALIGPGGRDIRVQRSGHRYVVKLTDNSPTDHPCPHIDALFHSVAEHAGPAAVGVILTGMGADGAQGLLAMRHAGARTLAQDEASSVVFGMPKEAIRIGAAERVACLGEMPTRIVQALTANMARGRRDTVRAGAIVEGHSGNVGGKRTSPDPLG